MPKLASARRPLVAASIFAALVIVPVLAAAGPGATVPVPPPTRRGEQTDVYHGVTVADPYRWLEEDIRQSPEVEKWVEAQNAVTFGYLQGLPERAAIAKRLTALWSFERKSTPSHEGGRYFFTHNDGHQNQSVLYSQASLLEEPKVVLDPNTWSADGTVALGDTSPSPDGRYLAYATSEAGSDWHQYHVLDLATGKPLADELHWVRDCCAGWTADSAGFFYSRFPEPPKGAQYQAEARDGRLFYHRVGTPQASDTLIFEMPDHPEWGAYAWVPEGSRYLLIVVAKENGENFRLVVRDLTDPVASPRVLLKEYKTEILLPFASEGREIFFRTDFDAPHGRVIAIDVDHPEKEHWREVIPEGAGTIRDATRAGNLLFLHTLEDASSHLRVFTLDGKPLREVALPGIGTVVGLLEGHKADTELFYGFSSFNVPPSIYRLDLATGESALYFRAKLDVQPESFVVERVSYRSKDGTMVPMFLAHKKNLPRDGDRPTLLTGYGGFNITNTPTFSPAALAWIERGGIYALPILRGGGEYGDAWHQAGMRLKKQNVFDDFLGAAEWLIANRYTRPGRLAAQGASNGGLLVAAAITQRPDLFAAALPHAGVLDMLRFQLFTVGRMWVHEYGSVDDPEEFKALYAYSPYHNVHPGTAYPATLIDTADTDDRVVPGHSFKFAAALERAQGGKNPILLRVETRAGHGGGLPIAKQIELAADRLAFLAEFVEKGGKR